MVYGVCVNVWVWYVDGVRLCMWFVSVCVSINGVCGWCVRVCVCSVWMVCACVYVRVWFVSVCL